MMMQPQQTPNKKARTREDAINILAVEDDVFSMKFLEAQIIDMGHGLIQATNGMEAIKVLQSHRERIDVILMDREMPVLDGMGAIKRIKAMAEFKSIPIIMVTSADTMEQMRESLEAGVFYYLTKPVKEEMLRSVLSAAIREAHQSRVLSEELGRHKTSFDLIETCKFNFRTLAQAESLAAFVANCFPEPDRVIHGLGELMINAIEHGNLGLGYDRKSELIEQGIWRAEIEKIQNLPEHADKVAQAVVTHKDNGTFVVISDQGPGFEWRKYITIDPSRAGDNHGRGIAQAIAMSFDKLTYNEAGNQVVAFVGKEKRLVW